MKTDDLFFMSLAEAARLVRTKAISCAELTRATLAHIERVDPVLKSYLTILPEHALRQAQTADAEIARGEYRGPLHGIPIGIKDLCDTAGIRTTCASKILWEHVPDRDATVVQRLNAAGAVTLGKLNLTEFAMAGYHGELPIPCNPWDRERSPGFSSSGSGVATAAGLCFAALGTDTGGSIRTPASWCGVVGLKPTWGRVSRYGVFPLGASLDHIGPMTRTVADAAAVLQVIAGVDPLDPTTLRAAVPNYAESLSAGVRGTRIGIDEDYTHLAVEPDVVRAIGEAAAVLVRLGAELVPIKIEHVDEASQAWPYLCAPEALAAHRAYFPSQAERYGKHFRAFLELGASMSAMAYAVAHEARLRFSGALRGVFEQVDAILCPGTMTVASPAYAFPPDMVFAVDLWPFMRFTAPFNLSGSPTLSLPCGFTDAGLPIGLQLVGRPLEESALLRIGHAYEQATDWHQRHPPL